MKKFIALLLFLVTISLLFCVSAFAITSSLDGDVLTISGSGAIPVKAFEWRSNVKTVIIGNEITEIGDLAFNHCTNIRRVILPSSLKKIGLNAFQDCRALEEINIPDGVKSIAIGAFYNCSALSEIDIPSSVTYIGEQAFLNCNNLTATLHRTATANISSNAFENVPNLLVKIPIGWSGDRNSFGAKRVKYGSGFITKTVSSWSELKSALEKLTAYQHIDVTCSEDWKMEESEDFIEISAVGCTINFLDNYSIESLCSDTGDNGVFFNINANNVTLNLNNKLLRTGNSTTGDYVSAIVVDGNDCHILNGHFYDCGAPGPDDDKEEVDGAAIYVDGESCTIQNCSFENCYGVDGGAVYVNDEGCNIVGCTFDGCKAYGDGGAICDFQDICHIENCTFKNCEADDDGGAIYICNNTDCARIDNCTFENCWCNGDGQYVSGDGDDPEDEDDTWVARCGDHFGEEEYYYDCACISSGSGSTISEGNVWIIAGIAIIAIGAMAIVVKKKKSQVPATVEGPAETETKE